MVKTYFRLLNLLVLPFVSISCGTTDSEPVTAAMQAEQEIRAGLQEECSADAPDTRKATCLQPTRSPQYYVDQALLYFDTLDETAPRSNIPNYSPNVARWEWEPWLKLTGLGETMLIGSDLAVVMATPSSVPIRDCRFFDTQPFARCRISFKYEGGLCPIYEEFTFNDAGETTFIEAWSDRAGLLPMDADVDPWAEGDDVTRLANRVPGLGSSDGYVDYFGQAMAIAAEDDEDLADIRARAQHFWTTWVGELAPIGEAAELTEDEIYGYGCGWED